MEDTIKANANVKSDGKVLTVTRNHQNVKCLIVTDMVDALKDNAYVWLALRGIIARVVTAWILIAVDTEAALTDNVYVKWAGKELIARN